MDEKMAGSLRMTLGDVDNERAKDTAGPSGGQSFQHVQVDSERGYTRHGSPIYYALLHEMADTHDKKSHDYASDKNPFGNYHFAGQLALLFAHSPEDAGFIGRIGEKIFRLANLDGTGKTPKNEAIEDTERDIAVIATLWMADRRDRRRKKAIAAVRAKMQEGLEKHEEMLVQDTKSAGIAHDILKMLPLLTGDHLLEVWKQLSQRAGEISVAQQRRNLQGLS